jgi:hypothetical protein
MKELEKLPLPVTKADKAFAENLVNAIRTKQDSRYNKNSPKYMQGAARLSDNGLKRKFRSRN